MQGLSTSQWIKFIRRRYSQGSLRGGKAYESGKIEIHVSENEKDALPFYEKMGYAIQGELPDHYRMDEICFILERQSRKTKYGT